MHFSKECLLKLYPKYCEIEIFWDYIFGKLLLKLQEIGCDHFVMNQFDCRLSLCNSSKKPARRFTESCSRCWSQSRDIIHSTDFGWRAAVLGPSLLCERTYWAVQLTSSQTSSGAGSGTCSWWNSTCFANTQSWYWNGGFLSLLWFETLALISQQLTLIVQDNKQQHHGKVPEYNSL